VGFTIMTFLLPGAGGPAVDRLVGDLVPGFIGRRNAVIACWTSNTATLTFGHYHYSNGADNMDFTYLASSSLYV